MALLAGTRLGPYEIVVSIGAGGMGEVYRAKDTKLNREVALKILPEAFTSEADRLARFRREAQVLASLNQPNIAAIYGFEDSGTTHALVMELVEGEDLSQHIARGPLALGDALPIARQIVDALEAAHEQGIVHRDLKPANIKVRADGTVKVLDFGLAKAMDPPSPEATAGKPGYSMNSPTMTSPAMTAMGMILGTAAYMAPEQARGKAVDKRADIWAFGAVLYEMLTGRRLFPGDEMSDVLAAVLRQDVDWSALPSNTPPRMRQLLARCLDRDVKTRLRDIGEARVLLTGVNTPESSSATRPWARDPRSLLALAAAGLAIAAAAWSLTRPSRGDADTFPVRIEINGGNATALSRDGHTVVFTARSQSGNGNQLYVRRLDQLTPRPIPGTEGMAASDTIFSPEGTSILFVANRHTLMRAPLDGAPVPVAQIGDLGGGLDWSEAGDIVAGSGITQGLNGLLRGRAAGGSLTEFTRVDASRGELSHQWPRILADGTTVLFTIWRGSIDQTELAATSLSDGNVVRLNIVGARVLDVVDGQLVYVQADGVAMAVPFNLATRRPTGTAIPVQNGITAAGGGTGVPRGFLTHEGGLLFAAGQPQRRLVWVDAGGRASQAFNEVRGYTYVRLSPDGRHVATTIDNGNSTDVWVLDLAAGGGLSRVSTTGQTRNPSWAPDNRRVFYISTHGGRGEFWWQPIDGSGPAVKAGVPPHNPWWTDVSPDGRTVIFNAMYAGAAPSVNWNLETLALEGQPDVKDFLAAPTVHETIARFSPDGTLVAYVSDESGSAEVYVRPFAENGARVKVSQAGGRRPIWSHDGNKIFWENNRQLMSATIALQPSLHVTSLNKLFEWNYTQDFDVAKDGRFLMIDQLDSGQNFVAVPNWRTELRRLTSAKGR